MLLLDLTAEALFMAIGLVLLIILSPAIILFIVGLVYRRKKPKVSKTLFILGGLYLLIGGGICGVMLSS